MARQSTKPAKKEPVHRIGPVYTGSARIEIAVFEKESDGRTSRWLSLQRSYKKDNDEWVNDHLNLFPGDLLPLSEALRESWGFLNLSQ